MRALQRSRALPDVDDDRRPRTPLTPLLRDEPALTPRARPSPTPGWRSVEVGRGRSPSPPSPICRAGARSSSPCPTGTRPASSPTTSPSSCAPTRSPCSRRGRRCRSSGCQPERRDDGPAPRGAVAAARSGSACPAVVVAGVRAAAAAARPRRGDGRADHGAPRRRRRSRRAGRAGWSAFGYRREELVEHRGEVARRGAIIDVFPVDRRRARCASTCGATRSTGSPRSASTTSARPTTSTRCTSSRPASCCPTRRCAQRAAALVAAEPWGREQWERLAEGAAVRRHGELAAVARRRTSTLLTDVLPRRRQGRAVEPRRIRDRAADLLAEEDDLAAALASTWGRAADRGVPPPARRARPPAGRTPARSGRSTRRRSRPTTPVVEASGWGPVVGDGAALATRLASCCADGYRVVVAADGAGSAARLHELLLDHGLDLPLVDPARRRPRPARRSRRRRPAAPRRHLPAAQAGGVAESRPHRPAPRPPAPARPARDSVVAVRGPQARHVRRALPARRRALRGHGQAGDRRRRARLPAASPTRATTSCTCRRTRSTRCASTSAARRRRCTASAAPTSPRPRAGSAPPSARSPRSSSCCTRSGCNAQGFAFGADTPWQAEMEDAFPYVETPDQRTAIIDVKDDMERPYPMDRLVCGDVGFGKTEVAIRAAFKAIQDGKQVAVLVPTTLLATQHGTHVRRPLRRLPDPRRGAQPLPHAGAGPRGRRRAGVGRGRLRDRHPSPARRSGVRFKDLGLLVVDEEQRFGVQHKEAMKQLKTNVDVLTLTATPIPRTLEMSLVGIRDLSLLNTPPADRQPILTYVGGYDERVAVEAIRRELLREGQVFWVHNRVRSIDHAAARLRELVPEARIAVAHGQMDEGTLEQVVVDFWDGQYDVLVCTTIIESGIDMPTVNTLVVERADLLGLGQLHQLRGRVGPQRPARLRLPVPPRRRGPHRGGVRAAEDDRRGDRARQRVQDRDARPRDPRRRQPARRGAVGPHRRRRLRPLLPDGHRGGGGDEGRAGPVAGRDQASTCRPTPTCPPTTCRRRSCGSRPTAGWPPSRRRPRSTTSAPSGRTATGRCPRPAEALLRVARAACRVPPPRRRATSRSPANQAPASPRCALTAQPGDRLRRLSRDAICKEDAQPARRADPARRRPGAVPGRLPAASWSRTGGRGDRLSVGLFRRSGPSR